MRRTRFAHDHPRGPANGPLARLTAAATLTAFLLVQSWVICLPICVSQGHGGMAMSPASHMTHSEPCHSGKVVRNEVAAWSVLGVMLPAPRPSPLPTLPLTELTLPAIAPVHLQQVPPADPPPPRSA